jgi:hypothetical protein
MQIDSISTIKIDKNYHYVLEKAYNIKIIIQLELIIFLYYC